MQDAIDALFFALDKHPEWDAGGRVLFLRARATDKLERFKGRLTCEQEFKPRAEALERVDWKVNDQVTGHFPLVIVMPDRQKDQVLADLARGCSLVEEGGTLVCVLPNDWGAKRFEGHLRDVTGEVNTLSKSRCRVFWTIKKSGWDEAKLNEWREGGSLRRILDGRFWSQPGLFSWDRIDPGSQFLIKHLPADIKGRVADLGIGWGFISDFLLRERPDITSLDGFDADRPALEATRRNLGLVPTRVRPRLHWHDVTQGLGNHTFDWIITNPPFHESRAPDSSIGLRFIAASAQALHQDGEFWLVANRHLPYENLMREAFAHTLTIAEGEGYKIMMGAQPTVVAQTRHGRKPRK